MQRLLLCTPPQRAAAWFTVQLQEQQRPDVAFHPIPEHVLFLQSTCLSKSCQYSSLKIDWIAVVQFANIHFSTISSKLNHSEGLNSVRVMHNAPEPTATC